MKKPRTSEELMLLINYIAIIGIWFAIPSVSLLLNNDNRWPYALVILIIIIILICIAYYKQWHVLFPRSSTEMLATAY